jgi:hypothetical protein
MRSTRQPLHDQGGFILFGVLLALTADLAGGATVLAVWRPANDLAQIARIYVRSAWRSSNAARRADQSVVQHLEHGSR